MTTTEPTGVRLSAWLRLQMRQRELRAGSLILQKEGEAPRDVGLVVSLPAGGSKK